MRRSSLLVSILLAHSLTSTSQAVELRVLELGAADPAAARLALEAEGARVTHVLPGGRMGGRILFVPGRDEAAAASARRGDRPYELAEAIDQNGDELRGTADAVAAADLDPSGDSAVAELGDAADAAATGSDSVAMAGLIVIGLVLPESTGAFEPSENDWSVVDVERVIDVAVRGTLRWALAPGAPRLTFVIHLFDAPPPGGVPGTVACAFEARTRVSGFDAQTDGSWLSTLGFTGPVMEMRRALAAWLRARYVADAAFIAKVIDDRGGANGRATAILGGPQATWYLSSPDYVPAHETGHIFGALDEYCPDACKSPSAMSGNQLGTNANSRGNDGTGPIGGTGEGGMCVMLGNSSHICAHTRSQIGWDDTDGDGSADVEDVYAETTIESAVPDTSGIRVAGRAAIVPLPGIQPFAIGAVRLVEVRIGRGAWVRAVAADGAFDSADEAFTAELPALPDGDYSVEARATAG